MVAYILDSKRSQRLADLMGIEEDLERVIAACNKFLSRQVSGSKELILQSNAMATFALISYVRTLPNGSRSGISASAIDLLPEALKNSHNRLKKIRDEFVAHSVNRQEDNYTRVEVDLATGNITGLESVHERDAHFSKSEMLALRELAEVLLVVTSREYDKEYDSVLAYIRSLPTDEILKLPTERMRPSLRQKLNGRRRSGR